MEEPPRVVFFSRIAQFVYSFEKVCFQALAIYKVSTSF